MHIHIAEQVGEVQDCLALRNARPVEWLLREVPVDRRWTLVHATHLTPEETRGIAASGATVAICPTTEANLGDGLFPLRDFLHAGGRWGIGSDSHVSVSPVEELRWLEYGQRLATRHRNIAVLPGSPSVGRTLLAGVLDSEADATGLQRDAQEGVWLDPDAPALAGASVENLVDRWLFAGNRPLVGQVRVGGRDVVTGGRHVDGDAIARRYGATVRQLLAD